MSSKDVLERFSKIRVWARGNSRAPHKPLLLMWSIGRCLRGRSRLASYDLVDRELTNLIRKFGPHRSSRVLTEQPFWRLRNDEDLWEIDRPDLIVAKRGSPSVSELRRYDIHGGLRQEEYDRFRNDPALALQVVSALLDMSFPDMLHEDILRATGVAGALEQVQNKGVLEGYAVDQYKRRQRYWAFRERVLDAYGERCAICAFSIRVDHTAVALDAAYIRWHAARGPAEASNGLGLCALHHRLFDYGAFTILPDFTVFVSEATEGEGQQEALGRYHQEELLVIPGRAELRPRQEHLRWHHREVFRTPQEIPIAY